MLNECPIPYRCSDEIMSKFSTYEQGQLVRIGDKLSAKTGRRPRCTKLSPLKTKAPKQNKKQKNIVMTCVYGKGCPSHTYH